MYTIVAILIFFKDHLFPPIRQIEPNLGCGDWGYMEIQHCSNHSILISNVALMATIWVFFFKRYNFPNQTCMSDYTETCWKASGSHGKRDFLNAVNSYIDHRNIQCLVKTCQSWTPSDKLSGSVHDTAY